MAGGKNIIKNVHFPKNTNFGPGMRFMFFNSLNDNDPQLANKVINLFNSKDAITGYVRDEYSVVSAMPAALNFLRAAILTEQRNERSFFETNVLKSEVIDDELRSAVNRVLEQQKDIASSGQFSPIDYTPLTYALNTYQKGVKLLNRELKEELQHLTRISEAYKAFNRISRAERLNVYGYKRGQAAGNVNSGIRTGVWTKPNDSTEVFNVFSTSDKKSLNAAFNSFLRAEEDNLSVRVHDHLVESTKIFTATSTSDFVTMGLRSSWQHFLNNPHVEQYVHDIFDNSIQRTKKLNISDSEKNKLIVYLLTEFFKQYGPSQFQEVLEKSPEKKNKENILELFTNEFFMFLEKQKKLRDRKERGESLTQEEKEEFAAMQRLLKSAESDFFDLTEYDSIIKEAHLSLGTVQRIKGLSKFSKKLLYQITTSINNSNPSANQNNQTKGKEEDVSLGELRPVVLAYLKANPLTLPDGTVLQIGKDETVNSRYYTADRKVKNDVLLKDLNAIIEAHAQKFIQLDFSSAGGKVFSESNTILDFVNMNGGIGLHIGGKNAKPDALIAVTGYVNFKGTDKFFKEAAKGILENIAESYPKSVSVKATAGQQMTSAKMRHSASANQVTSKLQAGSTERSKKMATIDEVEREAKELSKTFAELNQSLNQMYILEDSVKLYKQNYTTSNGFYGGSLGPNLDAQITTFTELAELGGFSQLDKDWLILATYNAGKNLLGSGNINILEKYFSTMGLIMLYGLPGTAGQEVKKIIDNPALAVQDLNTIADADRRLHLFRVDEMVIPASQILQMTYQGLLRIQESTEGTFDSRGRNKGTEVRILNDVSYEDLSGEEQISTSVSVKKTKLKDSSGNAVWSAKTQRYSYKKTRNEKDWDLTFQNAKKKVRLQVNFLAGFMDIVEQLQKFADGGIPKA